MLVVPLEQGWRGAAAFDGARIEIPYGINHGMVVCVEDVLLIARVTGDVNLRDAIRGNGVHVLHRIELVIHRGDVDVVHVEQDAAVGALYHFIEELPLGHLGIGEGSA